MLKVNFIVIKNSSKQWKKENNKTKVHKSSGLTPWDISRGNWKFKPEWTKQLSLYPESHVYSYKRESDFGIQTQLNWNNAEKC